VRVTKTLTFYEQSGNCSQGRRGNRRFQRFVQERLGTCVKCLYVLTGDKFHRGVHVVYGCVTYHRSFLRVESAADLLQSGRYSLYVLLTDRLWIAIINIKIIAWLPAQCSLAINIQSLVAVYEYTPPRNTQMIVKILNEIHIKPIFIKTDIHIWCDKDHNPLSCGKCMDYPSGSDDRPFNAAASVSAAPSTAFLREMSAKLCNELISYTHKDAKPSNCWNAVSGIIGRCYTCIATFRLRNDRLIAW
jgi:hypothetical protein